MGQTLMCPIHFQSLLMFLDPANEIIKTELKSNEENAFLCFRPF
jgi:hypothetical protein